MFLSPTAQASKAFAFRLRLNFLFELQLLPLGQHLEFLPELFGLT